MMAMNIEHIGSAIIQSKRYIKIADMMTPTLPNVSANMWRNTWKNNDQYQVRVNHNMWSLSRAQNVRKFWLWILDYPFHDLRICTFMRMPMVMSFIVRVSSMGMAMVIVFTSMAVPVRITTSMWMAMACSTVLEYEYSNQIYNKPCFEQNIEWLDHIS